MNRDIEKPASESALGVVALVVLCAGWLLAVILGDGFDLHRSAFAMPLVVVAALCGAIEAWRTGRTLWTPAHNRTESRKS